ncbi:MAG: tRNA pseudouridine(55) synthase TruB [Nitrospiraceae bacterium]
MSSATHITRPIAVTDGVLVVNKETGWTSHDVVAKVRGILGGVKVGHAGTLDPAAIGVLPVLVGRATRVAEYLVEWDKEYRAVLRLGARTDTQDATGTVLTKADSIHISERAVRDAVMRFLGPQQQLPPMHSAIKVGGRPLYKEARAGRTVERLERSIVIHELKILTIDGRDVTLNVVCSKGTYIRTLCADIGEALGVGGHLAALERRRVGPLSIGQALTVEQIAALAAIGTLRDQLISMDHVLEQLPALVVTGEQARRVLHGGAVVPTGIRQLPPASAPVSVRLKDETGRLLAIGTYEGEAVGPIKIDKVLAESGSRD